MRQHVERAACLLGGNVAKQLEAVLADGEAGGHVIVGNDAGFGERGLGAVFRRERLYARAHAIERPAQVDRRGARGVQQSVGAREVGVRRIGAQGEPQAIGRDGADERRAAHLHGGDGVCGVVLGTHGEGDEVVRELRLVEDMERGAVVGRPHGAIRLTVDLQW